jgi:protein kinase
MRHYEEISVLGDGAYGTVTKALDKETGELVAIKKMKHRFSSFEECLQLKEVKSLRKIKNENVMKMLSVFRENDYLYLVFELLGDSLLSIMNNRSSLFTEPEIRYTMQQILQGLNYIHRQGFFHRDIKPENLLWSTDMEKLKICDFGLAREIRSRPPYSEYVGTRWYKAPEILFRHDFYNSPVDIWAAGCIMAELYLGKPFFQGSSEADQIIKICNVLGTPSTSNWSDGVRLANKRGIRMPQVTPVSLSTLLPNASPEAINLIQDMLMYDPMKRPSASQCLKYPYFNDEMYPPKYEHKVKFEHPKQSAVEQPSKMTNFLPQMPDQKGCPRCPEPIKPQPSQGTTIGSFAARPILGIMPYHRRNVSFDASSKSTMPEYSLN